MVKLELTFKEKVVIYNLLSESYHRLKNSPETREENAFQMIEDLFIKLGADLQKEHGKDWWKKLYPNTFK
jgi:hypothetical protein